MLGEYAKLDKVDLDPPPRVGVSEEGGGGRISIGEDGPKLEDDNRNDDTFEAKPTLLPDSSRLIFFFRRGFFTFFFLPEEEVLEEVDFWDRMLREGEGEGEGEEEGIEREEEGDEELFEVGIYAISVPNW